MRTEDELWALLREAEGMPYGPAKIALIEQVLSRVDAVDSPDLAFITRMLATAAYTHGGEPVKSFVTFSWCVTEYDRDPIAYARHTHNLLWHFKYMINALRRFPAISLERTYAVLDDMERRYRAGGHSMHAVYAYRHSIAAHVGDRDAAEKWFRLWHTAPRDGLSDCAGCDPTSKAYWFAEQARDVDAIAVAEPVLGGKLTCVEQPQSILTALLLPYTRVGRLDAASDAHRRAYRVMRSNVADLGQIATHLQFLARTGNETLALEILTRHLPWLDLAPSPADAMDFAASGALVLRRVLDQTGSAGSNIPVLHRPGHGDRLAADVDIATLAGLLEAEALTIAAQFDARNGSSHQSGEVRRVLEAPPIVDELPIGAATRRVRPIGPTAIKTIAAPIPNEAGIDELLDLAEEHWHCDRIEEAIEVAGAFDERHAGADLTATQRGRRADLNGLVSANSGDVEVAEISWSSAIDLYAEAGDEQRRQLARCRVALLMCRTGRAEVGLAIAEDATAYLAVHAPKARLTAVHRRMALAYMFAGRADDALMSLDEAGRYVEFDPYHMAAAKLAAERAGMLAEFGRHDEARAAAEAARDTCRSHGYDAGVAASCWIIGRVAELGGELGTAIFSYEEGLAVADDVALRRNLRRQRAVLLSRTDRAAQVIDDLIDEVAETASDRDPDGGLIARHALAVAYLNAGRPLDAAETAEEALGILDAEMDPRNEIIRHALAQAFRALDQPDQALEQLELIAASGRARDSDELVAEMNEQMGDILDALDRDAEAATRYATAARAYRAAEQPLRATRAGRLTAMSMLWAGKIDEAMETLAAADLDALALDSARREVAWERAMLASEGARILAQHGDLDAALIRAAGSAEAFQALGDGGATRFAAGVYAHLLDRAERDTEAAEVRKLYGITE